MAQESSPIIAHAHAGYIQTGPGFYFAVCSTCGWQALCDRPTQQAAQADLSSHVLSTGVRLA